MERAITLTAKPDWLEIETVREKSSEFFRLNGLANHMVDSLTMVTSELVENSLKYGNFTLSEDIVTVDIHIDDNFITIEVFNPVHEPSDNHLRKLDRMIQWIRGYQDPFQAYVEQLKEVSKKSLIDEESGLGLVRIAYEGNAILDFFVGEDNILNVSAVSNF